MNPEVISVKEFVAILNETLKFAYPEVVVEGEISEFNVWKHKFAYFKLKEGDTALDCFMPTSYIKVEVEDGMKVQLAGSPRLTAKGRFSFTAKRLVLSGEGELRRAYELLKAKLEAEGLFAAERKRKPPTYPATIGLVTAATSAAYQDFVKILNQRWSGVLVRLVDVQVQGETAPTQITAALSYINQLPEPPDVLVLIRGGGSLEDLQAFNTEEVARSIAGSRVPIIVGVGHETDTSLADLAADIRAATPTDAARLVVPDKVSFSQRLSSLENMMVTTLRGQIAQYNQQLHRQFTLLQNRVGAPFRRVQEFEAILWRDLIYYEANIIKINKDIVRYRQRLGLGQHNADKYYQGQIQGLARILSSYSPTATLRRGYAIVRKEGTLVRRASTLSAGDSLMIQLAKGRVDSKVRKTYNDE